MSLLMSLPSDIIHYILSERVNNHELINLARLDTAMCNKLERPELMKEFSRLIAGKVSIGTYPSSCPKSQQEWISLRNIQVESVLFNENSKSNTCHVSLEFVKRLHFGKKYSSTDNIVTIANACKDLQSLSIHWFGKNYLSQLNPRVLARLTELNVSKPMTLESLKYLADHCRNLIKLNLSVTDNGMATLALICENNPQLESITLWCGNILKVLTLFCKRLKQVNLRCDQDDCSLLEIGDLLKSCCNTLRDVEVACETLYFTLSPRDLMLTGEYNQTELLHLMSTIEAVEEIMVGTRGNLDINTALDTLQALCAGKTKRLIVSRCSSNLSIFTVFELMKHYEVLHIVNGCLCSPDWIQVTSHEFPINYKLTVLKIHVPLKQAIWCSILQSCKALRHCEGRIASVEVGDETLKEQLEKMAQEREEFTGRFDYMNGTTRAF